MIGRRGRALTAMSADRSGQVSVFGEIWTATTAAAIAEGEPVEVVAVDGLTLRVVPAGGSTEGASS